MKTFTILLVMIVMLITACTPTGSGVVELTVPSKWSLESMGITGSQVPVVEGSTVTLEFAESGQVGGSGGCNSFGGAVEVDGSTIKITDVVSTLMACADDQVMAQESQFFAALQSATSFELSGDRLTIFYDNGQSQLTFVRQ